ncbi:Mur ligase family protein [Mesorhizobium sp. 10J20-29]
MIINRNFRGYFSLGKGGSLRTRTRPLRRWLGLYIQRLRAHPARLTSNARFIGISGSSGKSTTTALLSRILETQGAIETQIYNNTEKSISRRIRDISPLAKFCVVEAGISAKGDMDGIAKIVQPDVAIMTLIALEHYSAFKTKQAVSYEKGKLVQALRPGGFAVLNADDEHVMAMAKRTGERVVTFGRKPGADYRVTCVSSRYPEPLRMRIVWKGNSTDVSVPLIGEHFWVSVAAAFATAVELKVDIDTIVRRIAEQRPLPYRCEPVATVGGPLFIVDTAKAPWHSLSLALNVLEATSAPRKRIVLGHISDMSDSNRKYRDAYRKARDVCDQVIFVGEHAHRSKASKEDRASGRFVEKTRVVDAWNYVRKTAVENEIILLKSSPGLHLERIAIAWDRDVRCWSDNCGYIGDCLSCGLFEKPFSEHEGIRPRQRTAHKRR